MDYQPWACFSKDPGGKWKFEYFALHEEIASEFEDEHRDDDGNPTGFTVQMPDLDAEKRELVIKWETGANSLAAEWQYWFESTAELAFCQMTEHGREFCVIEHSGMLSPMWPDR